MPSFEQPMLATLTTRYFSDKDWIFERKFDGARCLIFKDKNTIFLKSRNNKILNNAYPELVTATKKLKVNQVILDGEIVAFHNKITSFEKLQARFGITSTHKALQTNVKIYIYIFDILYLDGYDLTLLPLEYRKSILKNYINFNGPIRYTVHKSNFGKQFFKKACQQHWEGLIAKKRDGIYVHSRSPLWLKFKCIQEQEMVIGGYTLPENSRIGFGSLLLGYYKNNKLMYAGKVGTGFSDEFLKTFIAKLKKITSNKNYFSSNSMEDDKTIFVKPKYVAQIGFSNWTKHNILRQPRFKGLRDDKNAREVIKEIASKKMS